MPCGCENLLPWFPDGFLQQDCNGDLHGMEDDDDLDAAHAAIQPHPPVDDRISMQLSLAAPGLLHITHNTANDLMGCVDSTVVDRLIVLCRFLSNPFTRGRVAATCFDCRLGRPYKSKIERYSNFKHVFERSNRSNIFCDRCSACSCH